MRPPTWRRWVGSWLHFAGVVWTPFDSGGGWKSALGRELQAAGFEIDWNKVMKSVTNHLPAIIPNALPASLPDQVVPALIADAGERPRWRYVEFFTANIRNPNTRRAYARACAGSSPGATIAA